jgi:signal transduction histidine kinase/ActR/RegA family two-component response regulator
VLTIGADSNNYPYSFIGHDGRLAGFAVDLTRAIEARTHLQFRMLEGKPSDLIQGFQTGEIDVLQSFASSSAREKLAEFSVPYLDLAGTMIVRKSDRRVQAPADMAGRRVLVHAGSLGEIWLKANGFSASICYAESVPDAMRLLHEGQGDVVLASRLTAMSLIVRNGYDDLEPRGDPLPDYHTRYCYAVRPGNNRVLAQLNEGLAIVHATGEFDRIYERWFGEVDPRRYSTMQIALAVSIGLSIALAVALVAVVRHRRLSQQVHQSERLYRGLFEKSPEGLVVIGPDPRDPASLVVQQLNPAARRLFGMDTDLYAQPPLSMLLMKEPALAERLKELLGRQGTHYFEINRSRDDRLSYWLVTLVLIDTRTLMVISDLSEVKVAEERLRRSEAQLKQSQKLEAIGTLASGIAHDFNNILTGIMGNAELLRMEPDDAKAVGECTEEIMKASLRAKLLVKQILTFSRRSEVRRESVDVKALVGETLGLLRAVIPANIAIRHQAAGELPSILGDPTQLNQVLMNLCTNAVQAMKDTQGLLEISEELVDIDESSMKLYPGLRPGAHVRLSVKDNGCGMPPEVLQHIYEPFYTTKAPGEGTGLGLAVVHGIVQNHGGVVSVYSQPGQGTVFRIYLPVRQAEDGAAEPPRQEGLVRGKGERILLLDDEPIITNVVGNMLRQLGYVVTTYNHPKEALAAFTAAPQSWDLVFSDLTMPVISGHDFAQRVFRLRPTLPFVLASGFFSEEAVRKAQTLGVRQFLDKPIAFQGLSQVVAQSLVTGSSPKEPTPR